MDKTSRINLQLVASIAGVWLLLLAGIGSQTQTTTSSAPITTSQSSLQVLPASQVPSSVINRLQGTGNLQQQKTNGLQQSPVGQSLQPNAKTDSLNGTRTVQ